MQKMHLPVGGANGSFHQKRYGGVCRVGGVVLSSDECEKGGKRIGASSGSFHLETSTPPHVLVLVGSSQNHQSDPDCPY